ncbi:hydroxyectoine utilization dehydratase EutB [Halobacillus andaensis]|uniref:threonine ammonia-lyase n=1 Tax=Halobacillus andaensis TaxID=1176239 RepID=A0A917EVY7_HALAA|nr:pyridoxal-phosphate dependent enzyme [Halobacillus andaensis]MBP2004676.1 threonine dehydratase [Halobacillus andaensis]GGF19803.1 hydroxyectoine utilization dehydratase EutB [Halobacillus andaensis]
MENSISLRSVFKAKQRIQDIITETPLIYSEQLSKETGDEVYLKLENLQPTGAFKLRGAANKILSLTSEEKQKGITTFSTGNHGIAVAYVAKQLGIHATVCISNRVPKEKVNRLERLDATVEIVGENQDDAEVFCYELEKTKGLSVIKPFDDLHVIAGQGTIGLEILHQLPEVQDLVIPLSGGGLLSGIAYTLKSIAPDITIQGVTMEKSAVMHESLKRGAPVVLNESDTLADSLLGGLGPDNKYTFSLTKKYMDESVLISEKMIEKGIVFMMEYHKMIIEGAAAAGIGRVMQERNGDGRYVVIVVTGNNVDHQTIKNLM